LVINSSGQYSLIVQNANLCVAKDTINVMIFGQAPLTDFSFVGKCRGDSVFFTDQSSASGGNTIAQWNWDFGDPMSGPANLSLLQNPAHMFSDTGAFTVNLRVTTNVGCAQDRAYLVHVTPLPSVNFSNTQACKNATTTFSQTANLFGYTPGTYSWNFGDPASTADTSNLSSPSYSFPLQTTYTVSLIVTNSQGCSGTLQKVIGVNAEVKADFSYKSPCANTPVNFSDSSIVPSPAGSHTYIWDFDGIPGSGQNANYYFGIPGTFPVTLKVMGNNGCNSQITKNITIYAPPTPQFSVSNFCAADTTYLVDLSLPNAGTITKWNWRLDGLTFSSASNPLLTTMISGSHTIYLTVQNNFGCKDSLSKTITVHSLPSVSFVTNPLQYFYPQQAIALVPNTNTGTFNWTASNGFSSAIQMPSITFSDTGTYTITLNYRDLNSCKGTYQKTLSVSARITDLAIINMSLLEQSGGFYEITADLVNTGSRVVNLFDIGMNLRNGGSLMESWSGTLAPGSAFSYTFVSHPQILNHQTSDFVCTTILNVNGAQDDRADNDQQCEAVVSDQNSLGALFPNPAEYEVILPLILSREAKITIEIYDMIGNIVLSDESQIEATGLQLVKVPVVSLEAGCYTVQVSFDNKKFTQQLLIR
jgi:PKD repeat protein